MPVYQILEKMHLNSFTENYEKIFIVLNKPDDTELMQYLKLVPRKKLTPFKDYYNTEQHCYYAFVYPKNSSIFITSGNIDKLINIILNVGYKIEYEMMKLLKENDSKDKFCFISK